MVSRFSFFVRRAVSLRALAFMFASSIIVTTVQAAPVQGLYSASVLVEGQGAQFRDDAFARALYQVLVKVSGSDQAVNKPELIGQLTQARSFALTFSYRENPQYKTALALRAQSDQDKLQNLSNEGSMGAAKSEDLEGQNTDDQRAENTPLPPEFLFDVSFAKSSVDTLLSEFQIPVWGATRPSILIWPVATTDNGRVLLSTDDDRVNQLAVLAQQRGLPIFFPVLDLVDLNSVDVDELWALYFDSVVDASLRYTPDALAIVKLGDSMDQWAISFADQQYFGDNRSGGNSFGTNSLGNNRQVESGPASELAESALPADEVNTSKWYALVEQLGQLFASRYAVQQTAVTQQEGLTLRIIGVSSFEDYVQLQAYLDVLPNVESWSMKTLKGAELKIDVDLKGSLGQLVDYLQLGGRLRSIPAPLEISQIETAQIEVSQIEASQIEATVEPQQSEFIAELEALKFGANAVNRAVEWFEWQSSNVPATEQ